jgi:hypothetical protein
MGSWVLRWEMSGVAMIGTSYDIGERKKRGQGWRVVKRSGESFTSCRLNESSVLWDVSGQVRRGTMRVRTR